MEDKNRIILFRVLAYVIDSIIVGLFRFVLECFNYMGGGWYTIAQDIFITAYYIYFHAKFGQTPGKMILTIKVSDYKTGSAISLKQSVLRHAIWIGLIIVEYLSRIVFGDSDFMGWITALPVLVILVLLLTIFADENGRGLHDKIAGTIVRDVFVRKAEV